MSTSDADVRPALQRTLSWVLAIIGPMFVVWFFLTGIERLRTEADRREIQNAGRVLNGRRVGQGGVVGMIEKTLERTQPQAIILGNSLSNTDINPVQLAREFDIPREKIQRFSIPNSIGAHWWIVLKNRVYANGHKPKLIILLSDMQSLLATRPLTEASYLNLRVHADDAEDEAYLDAKAKSEGWASSRIWENKGKVREGSLRLIRNLWIDAIFRHQLYNGSTNNKTSAAIDRVFDAGATDLRLHEAVIPIMQGDRGLQPFDPTKLPTIDDSFVPEIVSLVTRHGGKVVFLRPPMSPLLDPTLGDYVLPAQEDALKDAVAELGGSYVDLSDFAMFETDFYNVDHMNARGAKRFTAAAAATMDDLDPLGRGPLERARKGREIQLFGDFRLVDGELVEAPTAVSFKRGEGVPAVPRAFYDPTVYSSEQNDIWYFEAPKLTFLSDGATSYFHPLGARCSPVRVLEDGKPLAFHNVSCEEVFRAGRGRVCHAGERVGFSATDNTSPLRNRRAYTLGLDPSRACESAVWLYPLDAMRTHFPVARIARMPEGATAFRIEVIDMARPEKSTNVVQVTITVDGEPYLDTAFDIGDSEAGEREFLLDRPILGTAKSVRLEVVNTTNTFLLLTSAVLSEKALSDQLPTGPGRGKAPTP